MRLTKKLKKVITLSVLGTATVVLAGIASTKVIKTELAGAGEGRPDDVNGYTVSTDAEANKKPLSENLKNLEVAALELEKNANSLDNTAAKDTGFKTEPRFS